MFEHESHMTKDSEILCRVRCINNALAPAVPKTSKSYLSSWTDRIETCFDVRKPRTATRGTTTARIVLTAAKVSTITAQTSRLHECKHRPTVVWNFGSHQFVISTWVFFWNVQTLPLCKKFMFYVCSPIRYLCLHIMWSACAMQTTL